MTKWWNPRIPRLFCRPETLQPNLIYTDDFGRSWLGPRYEHPSNGANLYLTHVVDGTTPEVALDTLGTGNRASFGCFLPSQVLLQPTFSIGSDVPFVRIKSQHPPPAVSVLITLSWGVLMSPTTSPNTKCQFELMPT
uniref:TAXi_C domain-containing protein n=1 Tax=Mesocestoides corti TaxID=53468 RepID=A0A5K3EV80_MESCO